MPRLTDEMWKVLLLDVENTLNMIERVAVGELSTGYSVRYEQGKPMPGSLTTFERWRLETLQLLREVWGDIDEFKYQGVTARLDAIKQEHEKQRQKILATPRQ